MIYLQAPPDTLVERVFRRGNPIESGVPKRIARAVGQLHALFSSVRGAPVLIVNTENLNPIERAEDFELLLSRIDKMRGRREYFNLAA